MNLSMSRSYKIIAFISELSNGQKYETKSAVVNEWYSATFYSSMCNSKRRSLESMIKQKRIRIHV